MLRLSGKQLYNYDNAFVANQIKIYYTPTSQRYIVINNGKPYDLIKEGSFLIWDIPADITADPIKLKVQVMNEVTNATEYITGEAIAKRFADSPNNIVNEIDYDKDYPIYQMVDEHEIVTINDRDIIMPSKFPKIVAGDSVSKMITFSCPRYYNGVDMSKKACSISYINANKESGENIAVNVYKTDTKLYFGWLLNSNVTAYAGKIKFWVEFTGDSESGQTYVWQTVHSELKVEEGLVVDDSIVVERYPSIIEDMQMQLVNASENLINHDTDTDSHIDIRAKLSELETAIDNRDFSINPIDLETEVAGVLSISNVDTTDFESDIENKIGTKITSALTTETSFGGVDVVQLKADYDALKADFDALKLVVDGLV